MKHILALAVSLAIIFCQVVGEAEEDTSYNAAEVIAARTAHYKKVCAKYRDPRRVEYPALFEQPIHLTTGHNRNIIQNLFLCVPPKVGSMAWTKVFRRLYGQDIRNFGMEIVEEKFGNRTEEARREIFKKATRAMIVRHPLERVLSSYLFTFVDSSTHRDLSRKVLTSWIQNREADCLTPAFDEDVYDVSSKETLTFRQFVNFLTKCSGEHSECRVWTTEGVADHWIPFWKRCQPCLPDFEYHEVLELGPNIQKDKEYLFEKYGLNQTVTLDLLNPTLNGTPGSLATKKKYFGQLTKQEIHNLYWLYRIDHELFGYSPDEYISWGKD